MKSRQWLLSGLLAIGLFAGKVNAQFANGDFETSTPPPNQFNCNQTPGGWTASSSPSAVQWENRWNSSWWIDLTDCGWGNGRWLEQNVQTTPCQNYELKFDLAAAQWTDAGLDLYIDGFFAQHFAQPNDGINPLRWQTFTYNYIATGSSTSFKFVCNSISYAPVVGFDNVSLSPIGGTVTPPNVQWSVSDTCLPATLIKTYPLAGSGTSNWYYNGSLQASGTDTFTATMPGLYTLKFVTICGDTVTKDTTLVLCDTCNLSMKARYFCLKDSTIFTFNPADTCLDDKCIGKVWIDYGDGWTDSSPYGPVRFAHQYNSPGIYKIKYCWDNVCTGKQICETFEIEIVPCEGCNLKADFKFTACNPVQFSNLTVSNYHILSMNWDFGDGSGGSTAENPLHYFPGPGTYVVCLEVISSGPDGQECKDRICITVEVRDCGEDGGGDDGGQLAGRSAGTYNGIAAGIEAMYSDPISLFPNPSKGNVTVKGILENKEAVIVTLYDISGRKLYEESTFGGKDIILPSQDLDAGTYFINVKSNGVNKEIKFIKQ